MVERYATVLELIEDAFQKYQDRPAYSCLGVTISYGELDRKSQIFASYLRHELGLEPGQRFAIQLPNILQFPIALYGAIRAGLVIVNVNPLYTPREVKHQLNDAGAEALLVLSSVAESASKVVSETQIKHVIVTHVGDELPFFKRITVNFSVKYIQKRMPNVSFPVERTYRAAMTCEPKPFSAPRLSAESLAVLQYTGGTTGVSKGAMLSHGNLASNVWQMITQMPNAFDEGNELFIACLPLYHIYALNLHALSSFSVGSHNVLIPNPRDIDSLIATLAQQPFSVFIGINTLFRALVRHEKFRCLDFSKLKITVAGGMALTEDAAASWNEVTGCPVCEGYGLTETSPVLTGNRSTDIHQGSIGQPLPETDIRILDEHGQEVPNGEVGELSAKGPQVMLGYWQREKETADVMTPDGYLKTGDMAIRDDEGYLSIVDRKKDIILVSGFNVYPNEIEDVISLHPKVREVAAVGVPDERCGEVVKVVVVRDENSLTAEEVVEHCRENLTRYKVPKKVEFREELPKTNVGKILRRELRN